MLRICAVYVCQNIFKLSAGVFYAPDIRKVLRQPGYRFRLNGTAGAHGDVVHHDRQGHRGGNICIVTVQLLLIQRCEIRRDNGQHIYADLLRRQRQINGILRAHTAGPCIDRYPSSCLIHTDAHDPLFLLRTEDIELSVGTQAEDAVYPGSNMPVHLIADLGLIDASILVHGGSHGGNDTFDLHIYLPWGLRPVFLLSVLFLSQRFDQINGEIKKVSFILQRFDNWCKINSATRKICFKIRQVVNRMIPCRILVIAPYESMKNILLFICKDRPEVRLTVMVGDLGEGARLVQEIDEEEFDIVISRGGTAEVLRSVVSIPVVEIQLSSYDVLSALKLAENYTGRYALVAYPNIARMATLLCSVLQYEVPIYSISQGDTLEKTVDELIQQGVTLIIGDMVTTQYAKQHSLDAILITSGVESLENSIRQALQLHHLMTAVRVRDALLERQARQHQWELAVLQEDLTAFWESPSLARKPRLRKMMQKIAAQADGAEGGVQIRRIQEQPWKISCQRVFLEGSSYFFLQAEPLPEDMTRSEVVSFFSCEDISQQYFKKYINSALHQNLQRYAVSHSPVLILGEISTHKDRAANVLYANGLHRDHPLCVVDCDRADSKFWKSFLTRTDSPLYDAGCTFYFKNCNCLTKEQADSLARHILSGGNNRFLFSVVSDTPQAEDCPICRVLRQQCSCLTLRMPPLRERVFEIPALCSLYINEFNAESAHQVIGFVPEAMELLQSYPWPGNMDQLKRVIRQLTLTAERSYISAESVRQQLLLESPQPTAKAPTFDTNRTLEEMTRELVEIALRRVHGNQSQAAIQLGVSRSTLWRMQHKEK